jgi:ketosteroid isomerase-like protein
MTAPMLEGPLKIAARCSTCHENGGTAVVRTDWTLTAPDGTAAMQGGSAEVLRRGADGRWRFVIDDATFSSRPGES